MVVFGWFILKSILGVNWGTNMDRVKSPMTFILTEEIMHCTRPYTQAIQDLEESNSQCF